MELLLERNFREKWINSYYEKINNFDDQKNQEMPNYFYDNNSLQVRFPALKFYFKTEKR